MFLNGADEKTTEHIITILSQSAKNYEKQGFRAFVYLLNGSPKQLKALNKKLKADNIALALIAPNAKDDTLKLYKVNKKAKSTVFVYLNREIKAKWVNYDPKTDSKDFKKAISKVSEKK